MLHRTHANFSPVFSSPVENVSIVTSPFGERPRPVAGASTSHPGIDLGSRSVTRNPNILTAEKGVVLCVASHKDYGNVVVLGHADGCATIYGHMTGDKSPRIGQVVKQGEVIGVMGTSGKSSGNHLHFEIRKGMQAVPPYFHGCEMKEGYLLLGTAADRGRY